MKSKDSRILIVDDDPLFRNLIVRIFEINGFICQQASDGYSALEYLTRGDFDLVVMDIQMPKMSGIEVYQHLELKESPLLDKILFITGDSSSIPTQKFLKETGRPFLAKPFNIEEFQNTFKSMINVKGNSLSC